MERSPTPHICKILLGLVVFLALALTGVEHALPAEYYPGEPRATSYQWAVPSQCPASVKAAMATAAQRFNDFLPVSVVDGPIKGVLYDGIDSVTCGTFPPEMRFADCWNDRGLLACSEEVTSVTSNAVVGRATWWRSSDASAGILECDIQIDPGAEKLLVVAMHEVGHCAGLGHQKQHKEGLMYPDLFIQQGLHYDDIQGLCHLYGCVEDMLDDYGHVVIQQITRPGLPGAWTGVVTIKQIVNVERVE